MKFDVGIDHKHKYKFRIICGAEESSLQKQEVSQSQSTRVHGLSECC